MLKIKEGDFLWHPKYDVVIVIDSIFEISANGTPLFNYTVINRFNYTILDSSEVTQKDKEYAYILKRTKCNNYWDISNMILREFIIIPSYDETVPKTYRLLYAK